MPSTRTKSTPASNGSGSAPGRGPTRIWPALRYISEHPAQSGRHTAREIGVKDEGQMSRLLHRLRELGMIENAAPFRQTARWTATRRGAKALTLVNRYPHLTPAAIHGMIDTPNAVKTR